MVSADITTTEFHLAQERSLVDRLRSDEAERAAKMQNLVRIAAEQAQRQSTKVSK